MPGALAKIQRRLVAVMRIARNPLSISSFKPVCLSPKKRWLPHGLLGNFPHTRIPQLADPNLKCVSLDGNRSDFSVRLVCRCSLLVCLRFVSIFFCCNLLSIALNGQTSERINALRIALIRSSRHLSDFCSAFHSHSLCVSVRCSLSLHPSRDFNYFLSARSYATRTMSQNGTRCAGVCELYSPTECAFCVNTSLSHVHMRTGSDVICFHVVDEKNHHAD